MVYENNALNRIERGNSKLTGKNQLYRILDLVKAKSTDIFCDLGCGQGMTCIWASEKLSYSIGIENYKKNYLKAQKNKRKYKRRNVLFIFNDYEKLEAISRLKKCTIFFCTNELDYDFYKRLENFVKPKQVHFVSQYFAPYPIMSKCRDDVFIMKTPFKIARNEEEWLHYMLGKGKTRKDLYQEIRSFPDLKNKIKELDDDIDFINWLCKKCQK